MYKNPDTGYYEDDFRRKGMKRLHISYGVKRRDDAKPLAEAVARIVREKRTALIEALRSGAVTAAQIAAAIADNTPLAQLEHVATVRAQPPAEWPTLARAVEDYIAWLAQSDRKSGRTADTAKYQLGRFVGYAGAETRVDAITDQVVTAYQRRLYDEGAAQNTVNAYVWRVSGLYSFLVKREAKEARAARRAPRPLHVPIDSDEITNRKTRRDRALSEAEAERLFAATPPSLLFPVGVGLLAGLRVHEMLHLRPGLDVDTALWLFTIQEQPTWHPKNRKRRVVPITPQLRPIVEHHLTRYASDAWMMPSPVVEGQPMGHQYFSEHFEQVVRDAELVYGQRDPRGVTYHTLRHTFASWLVMKGVDLYTVSQLLGNTLKVVEDTYAHLAPDFRARAVERLAGVVAIPAVPQPEVDE